MDGPVPAERARAGSAGAPAERYAIATARARDLPRLAAVELAAARLLRGHLPARELAAATSRNDLTRAWRRGYLWVALLRDSPVGFALARPIEPDALHLCELHVHPDHARRGIGTRLVRAVCEGTARAGLRWVTLTTFRDVLFNMPFYARLRFEVIDARHNRMLAEVVDAEHARGLQPRVAMRRAALSSWDG